MNIHIIIGMHGLFTSMMSTWMMIACLIELIYLIYCIMVLSCIWSKLSLITLMDWITGTSWCSLLTKFSFCNCLWNRWIVWMMTTLSRVYGVIRMRRVEKLGCHHHLLLLSSLSIWCFPLVYKIEQVSLILILMATNSTCSTNSIVTNTWSSSAKGTTSTISFYLVHHVHFKGLLMVIEVTNWLIMTGIALSELGHKVSIAIKHGLTHLCLLLMVRHRSRSTIVAFNTKTTNSCLVENMLIILSNSWVTLVVYSRKHVMNSWIIGWLEHNTVLGRIHFVYTKRSVSSMVITASLFPHSISHEKCLVCLLGSEPTYIIMFKK